MGVYRVIRPRSFLEAVSEIGGAVLEGLVAQHLRAWIHYTTSSHELFFWRTKSGSEEDLILYGEMGLWAIEVKNGSTIHPQDLRSLHSFLEDYPEAKPILLYRGHDILQKGSILCLPCDHLLRSLTPQQPLL